MDKIFLVHNAENSMDEDAIVAVFNDGELATAFTERHPRFYGRYRIEEKELNPHFEKTDKWVYLVIIDANENYTQISQIAAFDDEQNIYKKPISKRAQTFFMYLFANDKNEALSVAKAKFDQMTASGDWLLMKDEADEETDV